MVESILLGAGFTIGAYLMFMILVWATDIIENWHDKRRKK